MVHAVNRNKSTEPKRRGQNTAQATSKFQSVKREARETKSQVSDKKQSRRKHHCRRCDNWHASGECPAFGQTCSYCKGQNHYASCCFKRRTAKNVDTIEDDDSVESDELFLKTVYVNSVKTEVNDWICHLHLNDTSIPVKLETGTQVNIMSEKRYNRLKKKPKLHQATKKPKGYYHSPIHTKGKCIVTVNFKDKRQKMIFYVVPGDTQPLLSGQACERLGLVKVVHTLKKTEQPKLAVDKHKQSTDYSELLKEYSDIFEGLGCLAGKRKIVINTTVLSVVHPCRKVPFALPDGLNEQLDRMESLGDYPSRRTDRLGEFIGCCHET